MFVEIIGFEDLDQVCGVDLLCQETTRVLNALKCILYCRIASKFPWPITIEEVHERPAMDVGSLQSDAGSILHAGNTTNWARISCSFIPIKLNSWQSRPHCSYRRTSAVVRGMQASLQSINQQRCDSSQCTGIHNH